MSVRFLAPLLLSSIAALAPTPVTAQNAPRPAAMQMQNVPQVPASLAAATRPYLEYRTANFLGWNAADRSMLIATRFANTAQLHVVRAPGAARTQISFEEEPVGGRWSPKGDVLLVSKDSGGSEFYQLYTLSEGKLTLLTDGKSRNEFGAWSKDGSLVGYSSTRRNGSDGDLYVIDPRDPKSDRMVAQVEGNGWGIAAFTPDKTKAVVARGRSVAQTELWLLDLASGKMSPIGDPNAQISYSALQFAPDGKLWALSDSDSDVMRLGTIDLTTGRFSSLAGSGRWDIEMFDISEDGRTIAYITNEAGISRLNIMNHHEGRRRIVNDFPVGVASELKFSPWNELGFTLSSARIPADAWSYNIETGKLTRWTNSETGGLDPSRNVEPELVNVKSFDGERMSGFLYRPDPVRFPGKRPMLMWIHGGPEGQDRPGFRGRYNYLVNEMGVAMFYPNVRGSSGYGKRFLSLDNGPFQRENSVKDIGAFLTALKADPGLDSAKFAQTGRSYGGYMCYATAIMFPADFRSANCVVPISDFVTFLKNTQAYRRDLRRVEYGDERDPKQLAQFQKIAPMRRIREIRVPLFVVAGENDPRVPASEARQVYDALNSPTRPVWLSIAQNEGHQWGKKENVDYQFWTDLMFWKATLLGE